MALSKKRKVTTKLVEPGKTYPALAGLELVKQGAKAKFDETVELAVQLGVDPKQSDQQVRGTVLLPMGSGVKRKVLVFAQGEKEAEAKAAGADIVGGDELVEKVSKGWLDFDVAVATPDMMRQVGTLEQGAGPPRPDAQSQDRNGLQHGRGSARSPKSRPARSNTRSTQEGVLHTRIGKASFPAADLEKEPEVGDGRGDEVQAPDIEGHLPQERGRVLDPGHRRAP